MHLDEACGQVQPPDLYAPDIPDECPWCEAELEQLDFYGCCPECGGRVEP
jgi:hypothetical protein